MDKIIIGDEIRCHYAYYYKNRTVLIIDKYYVIKSISEDTINVIDDDGDFFSYHISSFDLNGYFKQKRLDKIKGILNEIH